MKKYPHLKTLLEVEAGPEKESCRKSLLGPGVGVPPSALRPVRVSQSLRPPKAEELFARSMGADRDHWLGFQIQESLSARQQEEPLKLWLVTNKPSKVARAAGVGWISIMLGSDGRRVKSAQAKAEWERTEEERNMETVNSLASQYGDTGGKWLFHVSVDQVDKSWQNLALAMLGGGLGPKVSMIKVSPRGEENSHVIIVYNENYQDTTQVMRIENLLRSSGVTADLLYKPDIFSTLGIYRNNVWGFRPTIYSSKLMKSGGKSKITVAGTGKWYNNSSKGLEVKEDKNMNKIVADISKPEPNMIADYNKDDFKGEEKKKQITGRKKMVVKVDQNGNEKNDFDENHNKKTEQKESPASGQWIREIGMPELKSLDELVKRS